MQRIEHGGSRPPSRALERADFCVAVGRAIALAVAGVFAIRVAGAAIGYPLLAIACAHAVVRTMRPADRMWAWCDLALVASMIAVTGGPASPFGPYAQISMVAAGLALGAPRAMAGGLAVALAAIPAFAARGTPNSPFEFFTWLALFPVVGAAGGLARRIWSGDPPDGERMRAHANRVLTDLYRLATTLPVGLEVRTVGSEAIERARAEIDCAAAEFVVQDDSGRAVVASFGTGAAGAGTDEWIVAPVLRDGIALGELRVACPSVRTAHDAHIARARAEQIAASCAIGLENAQLFGKLRRMTVDDERARIAADLHDGVAQALAHLRFELDLLARTGSAEAKAETGRLARVADRALTEVRATVVGLRVPLDDGLAGSLRRYIEDLRGAGRPDISFEGGLDERLEGRLAPETETEIFRIAQEAASNAIRHARASRVVVSIGAQRDRLRLVVSDDGAGFGFGDRGADGTGFGLRAMRERAARINARLSIEERPGGGTEVVLDCPGLLRGSA
jgi:signal transduction histidine kinase